MGSSSKRFFACPLSGRKHVLTDASQQGLLLAWFAAYGLTVGPIPYIFAAEMPAVKLRSKTINLSRIFYYCCDVVNGVMAPYAIVSLPPRAKTPFLYSEYSVKFCRVTLFFSFRYFDFLLTALTESDAMEPPGQGCLDRRFHVHTTYHLGLLPPS
jgi:hypothetical protein